MAPPKWYKDKPVTIFKQASNPDDFEHGYDWRGYWKNEWKPDGGTKEWRKMDATTNEEWHWPDKYKQPHHHTFSNQSQYYTGDVEAGTWDKKEKFHPTQFNRLMESAFTKDKEAVKRRDNKEFNFDDFTRFVKKHKENDLSDSEIKTVWDSLSTSGYNPAKLAYLISTESKYIKSAKAKSSTAGGLGQMTKTALEDLYKSKAGNIFGQYLSNQRSVSDQMGDFLKYIRKYNKETDSYGEIKAKHLGPNKRPDDEISRTMRRSITRDQKSNLKGKLVKDLIDVLNSEYDEAMFGYDRGFKIGGKLK